MTIGEKIKQAREKKGWTQARLGKELGVTQQMIGIYEKNQRKPKIETIQKIADALDIPLTDLIEDKSQIEQSLTFLRSHPTLSKVYFNPDRIKKMIDEIVEQQFDEKAEYISEAMKATGMSAQDLALNNRELIESIGLYSTSAAKDILTPYSKLNEKGKRKAVEYTNDLAKIESYTKKEEE